jgi:hypothetical protein
LRAYNPVKKEPKDGLRIMIKFVPPWAIEAIQRRAFNQQPLLEWEFLDSIRVAACIRFRTRGYWRDASDAFEKQHCTALLDSTCESAMKTGVPW